MKKTIETFYKTNPYIPWIIWLLSTVFYFYEFSLQTSISVMVSDIMEVFKVSASTLGYLSAIYFYAYACMQIPVGVLLDSWGSRRSLTVAVLLCAIGCYSFAYANSLLIAGMGRLLMGVGSSFAAISSLHLAATWLPPKRFALLTGLLLSIGMTGAAVGEAPFIVLKSYLGWRGLLNVIAISGFILAGIIWLIIRDRSTVKKTKPPNTEITAIFKGIKTILANQQAWLISIYAGLMFAPTLAFGALWGTTLLSLLYPITQPTAATLTSMIFIGWIFGAPSFGWLSDYTCKRRLPFIIGSYGTLISLTIILYLPHLHLAVLGFAIFCFGFFSSAFLPGFALIRENCPPSVGATSLGFLNMVNSIGVALMQPAIGILLDKAWLISHGRLSSTGLPIYTAHHYQIATSLMPAAIVLSLLILPFIKESHCKPTLRAMENRRRR